MYDVRASFNSLNTDPICFSFASNNNAQALILVLLNLTVQFFKACKRLAVLLKSLRLH